MLDFFLSLFGKDHLPFDEMLQKRLNWATFIGLIYFYQPFGTDNGVRSDTAIQIGLEAAIPLLPGIFELDKVLKGSKDKFLMVLEIAKQFWIYRHTGNNQLPIAAANKEKAVSAFVDRLGSSSAPAPASMSKLSEMLLRCYDVLVDSIRGKRDLKAAFPFESLQRRLATMLSNLYATIEAPIMSRFCRNVQSASVAVVQQPTANVAVADLTLTRGFVPGRDEYTQAADITMTQLPTVARESKQTARTLQQSSLQSRKSHDSPLHVELGPQLSKELAAQSILVRKKTMSEAKRQDPADEAHLSSSSLVLDLDSPPTPSQPAVIQRKSPEKRSKPKVVRLEPSAPDLPEMDENLALRQNNVNLVPTRTTISPNPQNEEQKLDPGSYPKELVEFASKMPKLPAQAFRQVLCTDDEILGDIMERVDPLIVAFLEEKDKGKENQSKTIVLPKWSSGRVSTNLLERHESAERIPWTSQTASPPKPPAVKAPNDNYHGLTLPKPVQGTLFAGIKRKWTEEETTNLIEGYRKFGNNWTHILQHYTFNNRTNVNLKDKARNLMAHGIL